jgi:hypothetical protein
MNGACACINTPGACFHHGAPAKASFGAGYVSGSVQPCLGRPQQPQPQLTECYQHRLGQKKVTGFMITILLSIAGD